jgi:hypothetical protein
MQKWIVQVKVFIFSSYLAGNVIAFVITHFSEKEKKIEAQLIFRL